MYSSTTHNIEVLLETLAFKNFILCVLSSVYNERSAYIQTTRKGLRILYFNISTKLIITMEVCLVLLGECLNWENLHSFYPYLIIHVFNKTYKSNNLIIPMFNESNNSIIHTFNERSSMCSLRNILCVQQEIFYVFNKKSSMCSTRATI